MLTKDLTVLCWKKKKKEKLEAVSFTAVIGHILFCLRSSITLCPAAEVLFQSLLRWMKQHFLAFGIKNIIQAVPHINVCTDLKMPDVPTRKLARKMHIFNLKQMKLTLCHVYRAASDSPLQWSMSDSVADSWKHCSDILLFIFPNHRMWHVMCCKTNFGDVM